MIVPYEDLALVNKRFHSVFRKQFDEFLNVGWYILGDGVKTFEDAFATHNQMEHCVGVANGLDALILGIMALQLPRGSEIIAPANTYIASILAIIHAGHKPVLVEPDSATCNIDPSRIESAITRKTKAIMVVHLYGKCCEMDPILEIARRHKLKIVEDCAQAHDATYKGRKAGTFGDIGAFSFYPTKNLGALGDAGAVLTPDPAISAYIRKLRNYGSALRYTKDIPGYNSRLDELQAIFLKTKLGALGEITRHKRQLANLYLIGLKNRFVKPQVHPDFMDVYHIFNIRCKRRDKLRQYLLEKGIGTEIHYPIPPYRQKALEKLFPNPDFPISDTIHQTTLSLPCSYGHTEDQVGYVIDTLNSFG
jgi:dTDP-4-amino-4,6-dideoxygalactose transaminase